MSIIELMTQYPRTSLILISAVITLISSFLMKKLTDQEAIRALKKRQKELQKDLRECRKSGDSCQMEKVNKEAMEISMKLMKASFSIKQMLITLIPFLILFKWIRGFYGGEDALLSSWFWYYIGASIISSSVYRKLLKMA